jgi:hypothetical protein
MPQGPCAIIGYENCHPWYQSLAQVAPALDNERIKIQDDAKACKKANPRATLDVPK